MDLLQPNNLTLEDVFADFKSRRAGILKALTTDTEEFFRQCKPEKESVCLLGLPDGNWEVVVPVGPLPPNLPEPIQGINFARDGMLAKDWLAQVAICSDSWLISLTFFTATRCNFNKAKRNRLFTKINALPTICEVVTGMKSTKEKPSPSNRSSKTSKPTPKRQASKEGQDSKGASKEDYEENREQVCGVCKGIDTPDGFWICCDTCETWFHGVCVEITPLRADRIRLYNCRNCSHKKARR